MRYLVKLFVIYILIIAHPINAGAEQILSWKDCVNEALENHPDLVSAREKLNQVRTSKRIAAAGLLPQVSTDAAGKRSKTTGKKDADTYSYGITGKQLLFDGFKTPYDISAAGENIRAQEYNYEVTSSNVRLRLAEAFTELLEAQDFLYIAEDIAARRKKNLELVESAVMAVSGGIIGIISGIGIAVLLSIFAGWTTRVSIFSVVLATTFSAAAGIGFGLWPAYQASKLDPIEALRYE